MARLFTDVLAEVDRGRLVEEASEKMADLVRSIIEHGKPGSLVVTLAVAPNGEASVFLAGSVAVKEPQPTRGRSVFFADAGGSLSREDQRQREMFSVAASKRDAFNG